MKKSDLRKYAKLIACVGANVQKGQQVKLSVSVENSEFALMVVEECYKAGASKVTIDWSVDDGIIPADFLKLHYEDASNLPILGEQLHNLNTAIPTSSNDNKSNDLVEDSMCQSPETETPNYTIADAIDDFCIIIKKLIYKA